MRGENYLPQGVEMVATELWLILTPPSAWVILSWWGWSLRPTPALFHDLCSQLQKSGVQIHRCMSAEFRDFQGIEKTI